jgi:hypothetical protein
MSAFQRDQRRATCAGICLNAPKDACPPGKWPFLSNVRSYQLGTLQARLGLTALANGALGAGVIHSIARLNDPTPFAASAFWRVFGKGAAIFAGNSTYPQIDTGYSANPLTLVTAAPIQSPSPWVYVGDSTRQRKFDVNSHLTPIGIAPPVASPTTVLDPLFAIFVDDMATPANWLAAGGQATAPAAVALRINTTISSVLYDSGVNGNCSVVPVAMTSINIDAIVVIGGEALPVQQITIPVVTTTIAAILYDAGATGLCTIQPAASLGTGQLEGPSLDDYLIRAGQYGVQRRIGGTTVTPVLPVGQTAGTPSIHQPGQSATRIRQVDFPVNCLVTLGGAAETVRILSVSLGPDGIQSFRCSTANAHSVGQSITGVAAFRVSSAGTFTPGLSIAAAALTNTITPAGSPPAATGGIQTLGFGWTPINNLATQGNGIATRPDDDFHISIRVSDCTEVTAVRAYLDVDAAIHTFVQNYFFFEWRSNDILAAIQQSNASPTATLQSIRPLVVQNEQLNSRFVHIEKGWTAGTPLQQDALTQALAIGNNQWLELHCKVRDFIHVGTDPTRTLANVGTAEILVAMAGGVPITVDYGAIWMSGGSNPDIGLTGSPRVYAYRYRSSLTGAISNPSPASRGGMMPQRQTVTVTGVQSADIQVDLVDWFTIGGTLDRMTYEGTTPNSNPPVFVDNYSDSRLVGGPSLDYDRFQPWATSDKFRTGTCNVAGSAVKQVSGDTFNTSWAPGSIIIISGQQYTLRAQPTSTTFLEINENAGSGTGVAFTLVEPTLLGQPLYGLWGPDADNVFYACGDPNNPGFLYWTFPNDPDRTSDANTVMVTSGSERLQNGCVYDDRPYVWSTDNLYAIVPTGNGGHQGTVTPCGRGVWTPWFFCVGPEGIFFGTKDGIFLTAGGSAAVSVTEGDLSPLFPHDGSVGVAVNGVLPPDYTQSTRLRLSYLNGWVYFDYLDTGATARTLAMRVSDLSWWFDTSTPGIAARLNDPGSLVTEELLGGTNGTIYLPGGTTDAGTAISAQAEFVANQGDARLQKLYRDCMVEADLTSASLAVTLSLSNAATLLGTTTLSGVAGRSAYQVNVLPTTGAYGTNLTVDFQWNPASVGIPLIFLTDIAYQNEVELASSWLSGPTTFGLSGYLQIPLVYVAYLSTSTVTMSVIIDNVLYTYTLPSTGGVYAKAPFWLQTIKGLTYQLGFQSATPFMVFDKDLEFFVQPWGQAGGYKQIRPF